MGKEKLRACKKCEYFHKTHYSSYYHCHLNSPTTGDPFPQVQPDDFCSKWEPEWTNNETITKAWDDFLMITKLADGESK